VLLASCRLAFALNPTLDISQYAHKSWTVEDGVFKGAIRAIAQTPDGYLWLGSEFGLLRFDGVRPVEWTPPPGEQLPGNYIGKLLVTRDGRLWIGTDKGLASWKDGKLTQYAELSGKTVSALAEDREGTVWVGTVEVAAGRLCAIQGGRTQCYGEDGSFGQGVLSVYEDPGGILWAGAGAGLWRWKPGPPKLYPLPAEPKCLISDDHGHLLIASTGEIRQFVDGKADAYLIPSTEQRFGPTRLLRDREGSLWIGTASHGLWHEHGGGSEHRDGSEHPRKIDVLTPEEGLSADYITDILEDREGNIWVATQEGLDRFRDFAVPTISVKQGLSTSITWSVLAAKDGTVWIGTTDGLNRWDHGQVTTYRKQSGLTGNADSLFEDERGRIWLSTNEGLWYFEDGRFTPVNGLPKGLIHNIVGDGAGNLWLSHDRGLIHLVAGDPAAPIPWSQLGTKEYNWSLLPDSARGGLWLGFVGELEYFKDGRVQAAYSTADGLGEGRVAGLQLDRDETVWAATEGGLSRLKDGRIATLTSRNGLPCNNVQWTLQDDDQSFWMYTACGLVRVARSELDAWALDLKRTVRTTVFDNSDGVRARARVVSGYSPRVTKSVDGKFWFVINNGVSVIDPHKLSVNTLPPPVHIEQIIADGKNYWQNLLGAASSNPRLPALVRDLEIDYTALSFAAPEKVQFRYKLEGWDRDWQDAGTRRQAFYNDLPPRQYRFRVMASNNNGVWNEAGASLDFSVAPAYYQTTWFALSCGAAFLALLAGAYQLRLRHLARQFSMRLEERVNERTRIARELHDTLLQSFQGVLLKFNAVTYLYPDRPAEAQQTLQTAIEQARDAITEGRDAVQGLRSSTMIANDLARSIGILGETLAADHPGAEHPGAEHHGEDQAEENRPGFRVLVEGSPRDLVPILRDEVYRIAGEALRNAFRHAHARQIEVEIRYGQREFRLRVRDDGRGIEPKVLESHGKAGHYGLPGMRERARLMQAKLVVWSELESGTEIELTISASAAYEKSSGARRWTLSGKGG
jgi:signal transduction histidine kinase/ligand-binding sensor domain-containing protein